MNAPVVRPPPRVVFSQRVKRGLALLAEGNGAVNASERRDLKAARAWIAWGVQHCGWLVKRKRRAPWRQSVVANPAVADKRGYS